MEVPRLKFLNHLLNMTIKNLVILIMILAIINCFASCHSSKKKTVEGNKEKNEYVIDSRGLIVDPQDLSVLLELKYDTVYRSLEDSLVQFKGFSLMEAEQTIQKLIDEGSLPKPFISYYDSDGYQQEEFSYKHFKKYIGIIKDSLEGKEVQLDSTNFPFPRRQLNK